jgi:hypothetical protein
LVLVMNSGHSLAENALQAAAINFSAAGNSDALIAHTEPTQRPSLAWLFAEFRHLILLQGRKTWTRATGADCVIYKRDSLAGRVGRYDYADDILVYSEPASLRQLVRRKTTQVNLPVAYSGRSVKRLADQILKAYILLLLIAAPFLIGYFIYLAVKFYQPFLLELSVISFAVFLAVGIWNDSHVSFKQKLALTVLMPVAFSLLLAGCLAKLILTIRNTGKILFKFFRRPARTVEAAEVLSEA